MDHGVGPGHEAVDERGVADVARDELDAVGGQPGDVLGVARVGQLVEDGDVDAGVLAHDVVDEVGADEAAAAGDDDALGLEGGVGHGILGRVGKVGVAGLSRTGCSLNPSAS